MNLYTNACFSYISITRTETGEFTDDTQLETLQLGRMQNEVKILRTGKILREKNIAREKTAQLKYTHFHSQTQNI